MPGQSHLGVPVNQIWDSMVQNPRHPLYQQHQQQQQKEMPQVINITSPAIPPAENRTDIILMVLGLCFFVCALLMVFVVSFLHSQTMAVINSQQNLFMYMFHQQQHMWHSLMKK